MAAVSDPSPAAPALAERLAAAMTERWQRGERPLAEDSLAQNPQLWHQPEGAIDLIYEELCLRRRHGLDTTAADLLRRFPEWRRQLDVLLRCHQLLECGLAPPAFPAVAEALGDLRLLAELGQGSRGRAYLATQPALAYRRAGAGMAGRHARVIFAEIMALRKPEVGVVIRRVPAGACRGGGRGSPASWAASAERQPLSKRRPRGGASPLRGFSVAAD
jgi:hypothetical protein